MAIMRNFLLGFVFMGLSSYHCQSASSLYNNNVSFYNNNAYAYGNNGHPNGYDATSLMQQSARSSEAFAGGGPSTQQKPTARHHDLRDFVEINSKGIIDLPPSTNRHGELLIINTGGTKVNVVNMTELECGTFRVSQVQETGNPNDNLEIINNASDGPVDLRLLPRGPDSHLKVVDNGGTLHIGHYGTSFIQISNETPRKQVHISKHASSKEVKQVLRKLKYARNNLRNAMTAYNTPCE